MGKCMKNKFMKNKFMKKSFFVLFITIALLAACNTTPNNDFQQPVMNSVQASAAIQSNSITVRGTVESVESRNVYSTSAFMVEHIYVEEGDFVTEGQILAELDTADLVLSIAPGMNWICRAGVICVGVPSTSTFTVTSSVSNVVEVKVAV